MRFAVNSPAVNAFCLISGAGQTTAKKSPKNARTADYWHMEKKARVSEVFVEV